MISSDNAAINIEIKIIKKKTTVKMTFAPTVYPFLSFAAKNSRKSTKDKRQRTKDK